MGLLSKQKKNNPTILAWWKAMEGFCAMKKLYVGLFLLLTILPAFTGCGPEYVYDLEKFNHVNAYVQEIVAAIEETAFDFELWVVDPGNAEKLEWLEMDAEWIEDINLRYLTGDFPDYSELETWVVPVSNDKERWTIKGSRLVSALEQIEASTPELAGLIFELTGAGGDLFLNTKSEEIRPVLNKALEAATELKELFRLQEINGD